MPVTIFSSGVSRRGFTLVEIMITLIVLSIGMAAVLGIVIGSFRDGQIASDRNAAAILLPEALRMIELEHRIDEDTPALWLNLSESDKEKWLGGFILTVDAQEPNDSDKKSALYIDYNLPKDATPSDWQKNWNEWPRRPDKPADVGGFFYRVRYRLENHPSIVDLFVLTTIVFRDDKQDMSKPQQITDPTVVYLRRSIKP